MLLTGSELCHNSAENPVLNRRSCNSIYACTAKLHKFGSKEHLSKLRVIHYEVHDFQSCSMNMCPAIICKYSSVVTVLLRRKTYSDICDLCVYVGV